MGEQTERCSAYVVIPAPVFFDRDLPPSARLLYGLISNLCNDRGYCWARNETLCRYLEVKERTLRGLLGQLREKGYIVVEQSNESGITIRKIALGAVYNRPAKNCRPPGEKLPPARQKIAAHTLLKNNLSNNNTPLTPLQGEGKETAPDLSLLADLDPALTDAVREWLTYKQERRQAYKPTGLKRLITQVHTKAEVYGWEPVAELIMDSIANGYQGILWDRLKPKVQTATEEVETW